MCNLHAIDVLEFLLTQRSSDAPPGATALLLAFAAGVAAVPCGKGAKRHARRGLKLLAALGAACRQTVEALRLLAALRRRK
jgi:hypothetical protein